MPRRMRLIDCPLVLLVLVTATQPGLNTHPLRRAPAAHPPTPLAIGTRTKPSRTLEPFLKGTNPCCLLMMIDSALPRAPSHFVARLTAFSQARTV